MAHIEIVEIHKMFPLVSGSTIGLSVAWAYERKNHAIEDLITWAGRTLIEYLFPAAASKSYPTSPYDYCY